MFICTITKQKANNSKAVNSSLLLKGSKKMTRSAVLSNYHIQTTNSVAEISDSISISHTTGGYVRTYVHKPASVMSIGGTRTRLDL